MGSNGNADLGSVHDILLEARSRLTDSEYTRLETYADLLLVPRVASPATNE